MRMYPVARRCHPHPLVFLLALFLAIGGAESAEAQTSGDELADSSPPATSSHPLRAGDIVEVTSWREPDLSGEYMVDEDGRAVLPLLGGRMVAGRQPSELRRELLEEYRSQFRQDSFQVTFKRRVRILGEVTEPGLYHIDSSMNLGDVIALAGGVTPDGNPDQIRVMREGETVREVQMSPEVPITDDVRSGDQIMVLRRSWFSRNMSLFVGALASGVVYYVVR